MTEFALVSVVCGLLTVAMVPSESLISVSAKADGTPDPANRPATMKGERLPGLSPRQTPDPEALADLRALMSTAGSEANGPVRAKPRAGEGLFPLQSGTEWIYKVTGPSELVPGELWTQRLVRAPAANEPGVMEAGFGDERTLVHVYSENGSVRFDGLPFTRPLKVERTAVTSFDGELVPHPSRVIDGAVWTVSTAATIRHKYLDKKGVAHERDAESVQTDRAQVAGLEKVVVPAGRFDAYRVRWQSRYAIKAGGRPVLEPLTASPYRRETMWIAPGYGIVRRSVAYKQAGEKTKRVSFDLVQFKAGKRP